MTAGVLAAVAGLALAASPASAATAHGLHPRAAHAAAAAAGNNLIYGGGPIVTSPQVYIVYWGNQWGTGSTVTNDPSGEAALQQSFFQHAYGSGDTFFTSQTQYCQGVASGTTQCNGAGTPVGHPSSNPLAGSWLDNSAKAPTRPSDSQLAAEAVKAAAHFGVSGDNIQIIVDSPHGVVPSGFKTQYCAWHDVTTNASGADVPYTNMPYITDAGASCGANFVSPSNGVSGTTEGITIVGGHEYAETLTDPEAGNGWLDSTGYETGDKCAWISSGQGASAIIALNGAYYAVQSLWSNNYGGGAGNCVTYYASASNQH
jgi:serine protease